MRGFRWRQVLAGFGLLTLLSIGWPAIAQAHVLKQDNGVAAVLHIPPEDNPQAQQPTNLQFSFGSTGSVFDLAQCDCTVAVVQHDQVLSSVALTPAQPGDTTEAVATVNFPAAGVYTLQVDGRSRDGKFPTFQLNYLERVVSKLAGQQTGAGAGSGVLIIGAGSFIILVMVGYTAIKRGGRYAANSKEASRGKTT